MKFKGTPNLFVRISNKYVQRATGIKGFYFNEVGEYEAENPILIKVIGQNFETIQEEPKTENNVTGEEIKLRKCKKCEFECETQGELLQHYKKAHPKEGKQ
jgi:hypothetical protein